ncbi:MAG: hypothetical protein ACP6IP_10070 [Candidatus Njordarchaeia archaeon]
MSIALKSLYYGLSFRKKNAFLQRRHPFAVFLHFSILTVIIFLLNPADLLVILFYLFLLVTISKFIREEAYIVKGLLPLVAIVFGVSTIFYNLYYATITVLRIISGSISISLIFLSMDLDEIASIFNKYPRVGKFFSIIPIVSNLIPITARDAINTIEALYFRGEIKGRLFKPSNLIKFVTVFIASVLWRSRYLAEALALKGFGKKKKVVYLEKKFGIMDALLMMFPILLYLICSHEVLSFLLSMII